MYNYFVTYNHKFKTHNKKLEEVIKTNFITFQVFPNRNIFFIQSRKNATDIRDMLNKYLVKGEQLFVGILDRPCAWHNIDGLKDFIDDMFDDN